MLTWENNSIGGKALLFAVLILILMECSLGIWDGNSGRTEIIVLILILMECSLGPLMFEFMLKGDWMS